VKPFEFEMPFEVEEALRIFLATGGRFSYGKHTFGVRAGKFAHTG
jgi:hypothetical protein